MHVLDWLHGSHVHSRRVRVLSRLLIDLLPATGSVLDVGCGDGLLAARIREARSGLTIRGVDVLVRKRTWVPVSGFDGVHLDCKDRSVDVVLFVDVLHHAADPIALLREARRVARRWILIKDHTRNGPLAGLRLRVMDWVGNARHAVALPYRYWMREQWRDVFQRLDLAVDHYSSDVPLYSGPGDWVFGRGLQFVARVAPRERSR